MIKGAFLFEPLADRIVEKIIDAGVNEISLKWEYYDQEIVAVLRSKGIKVYAEISLFVSAEMWQKYPDSRPIDRDGTPMEPINWYYGVCPNHPGVRNEKLVIINQVIESFSVDGIWLDFIRYPCHWEEVRSANISEYCFCPNCLEKYAEVVGRHPAGNAWNDWKCQQIIEFVQEVRSRIELSKKPIQLGMFAVPWTENTYGNALRSIVCQDLQALSEYVDVYGVMTYHRLTNQSISWIGEVVDEVAEITQKSVVPLVQSIDVPEIISGAEFRQSIKVAANKPSDGVIIFHFHDLLENETKYETLKSEFGAL